MTKTKFTEENKKGRTVMKVDTIYKCGECGDETHYVDYCTEGAICSHECYDDRMDKLTKWAREVEDLDF